MSATTETTWTCDRCGKQEVCPQRDQPAEWVACMAWTPPLMSPSDSLERRLHLWVAEWAAGNDVDEGWYETAEAAARDDAVVRAFSDALDVMARKITYRMADRLIATYEVTYGDGCDYTVGPRKEVTR